MKTTTKFVGLDVSKEKIAVAVADEGRKDSRFVGMIPHTVEAIRNLVRQLGDEDVQLEFCYEAGPTGYGLYRLLHAMDLSCTVIAPSLIPIRQGDRVKTDKRDALRLAQLFRAGELTSVFVPSEENESLRDLVRAREDAIEDRLRARHQLSKFLLRHDRRPQTKLRAWGKMYERWLDGLSWTDRREQVVFQEYRHHLQEIDGRVSRLEAAIHLETTESERAPVIQALQTLRGVAEVVATSLGAEIGEFRRFRNPKQLMAYAGLVPSEYSRGVSRRQGRITKSGNAHLRRVLGEAGWCYRYKPAIKETLSVYCTVFLMLQWRMNTLTIFMNKEIARLMELTEVNGVREYIHVRREQDLTFDGQILETSGGIAVCTGAESQLNYVVGLGFTDSITTEHVSEIEKFFDVKGVSPTFEVCPLADPSLWKTLSQLGYQLHSFTNVWIMSLKHRTWMKPNLSNAVVQHVDERDSEIWARTVSSGFSDGAEPIAEDVAFGLGFYHLTGTKAVMVKENGEAVAGGIVGIENTIADLFFTSTLPSYRGKGYQSALVQERLRIAKAENCEFAITKTEPGSVSQHTMERVGFQLAYTRFTLSKLN